MRGDGRWSSLAALLALPARFGGGLTTFDGCTDIVLGEVWLMGSVLEQEAACKGSVVDKLGRAREKRKRRLTCKRSLPNWHVKM
jgi:hypothetical protein